MEKITTSEDVTAAFTTWYADKSPANLNRLMTACRFPTKLAFHEVGAKLRRRRDLTEDDLFHAGLVDIWKTIIHNADSIYEHTLRPDNNGLVPYFKQAAQWGMLRVLSAPDPTCTLSAHNLRRLAQIRKANRQIRDTGVAPTDEQLATASGFKCVSDMKDLLVAGRAQRRLDETTEDGEPQAWTPGRYDRNLERLENRELCAKVLRLLAPRDRWRIHQVFLKGKLVNDLIASKNPNRVSGHYIFKDTLVRAVRIIAAAGLATT